MSLKGVREALGLSQVELDRLAKQRRGTVQDIESGRNQSPSLAVALAIVDALHRAGAKGVTVEGLFATQTGAVRS